METIIVLVSIIGLITKPMRSLNVTCPAGTNLTWTWDNTHTGQRPDCPAADVWAESGYMWHSISVVETACAKHPTCNFFQRYGGGGPDHDCDTCYNHNYAHACPDLHDISWIEETRWGIGAPGTNNYQLDCDGGQSHIETTEAYHTTGIICPEETPLEWRCDTSHTGLKPDCPAANVWAESGYMWHSISVVKAACEDHPTCNFFQRYDGGGTHHDCDDCYGHNYAHACPDLNDITWTKETRWGYGASGTNNYQFGCDSTDGKGSETSRSDDGVWVTVVVILCIVILILIMKNMRKKNSNGSTVTVPKQNLEMPIRAKMDTVGETKGNTSCEGYMAKTNEEEGIVPGTTGEGGEAPPPYEPEERAPLMR